MEWCDHHPAEMYTENGMLMRFEMKTWSSVLDTEGQATFKELTCSGSMSEYLWAAEFQGTDLECLVGETFKQS